MIMRYRGVAVHPEVDAAIEDITNESIAGNENKQPIDINTDNLKVSDKSK